VCAHAVRVSVKAINGVDAVDVNLGKGLATVSMKPGNSATLKQMHEAIAKNGFTMKQTELVVRGEIEKAAGKFRLKVSGSSDVLDIAESAAELDALVGKQIELSGTMPEPAKNQVVAPIKVKTATEVK
jgi:copper chaperone CopZ